MVKLVEILYLTISKIAYFLNKALGYFNAQTSAYPNVTKSVILHIIVFAIAAGMVPSCSRKVEAPKYISIQITPLSSSDKQAAAPGKIEPNKEEVKPEPKPEAKPEKPVEKPEEVKKPPVKQVMEKPNLAEKKPNVKPLEKPVEKPTPNKSKDAQKKKKEEDKIKKKEDEAVADFKESLLKNLEQSEEGDLNAAPTDKKPTTESKSASGQGGFVPDAAFVDEIMGKIQSQVSKCWSIPIGAQSVENIKANIYISLDRKGAVLKAEVADSARYASDVTFRVVADSAVRAVKECSPIRDLPEDKHQHWGEIEFTFDPKYAL
jgi:outer membrane biosynthesis protein TonB